MNIDIDRLLKEKGLSKTEIAKRKDLSRESLANVIGVPVSELFQQSENTVICPNCGACLEFRYVGYCYRRRK